MKPAFEVGEADRYRLDLTRVMEIPEIVFFKILVRGTGELLGFSFKVEFFKLFIGNLKKVL